MLTEDVLQAIDESVLCWLATADADGTPNVSPKEMFVAFGDSHLLIANIMSPGSARNVRVNPNVCVSFVHVFKEKGFKLRGTARYLKSSDDGFEERAKPLREMAGERFPFKTLFEIEVTAVEPILAPSYRLYPDEVTEQSKIAGALRLYRVKELLDGVSGDNA